jgi:DNA-binding MarR family transcriptional regulator
VDAEDRRAARLFLTPDAAKRLRRWRDARTSLVSEALAMLTPEDEATLENVRPVLHRLIDALATAGSTNGSRLVGSGRTLNGVRRR